MEGLLGMVRSVRRWLVHAVIVHPGHREAEEPDADPCPGRCCHGRPARGCGNRTARPVGSTGRLGVTDARAPTASRGPGQVGWRSPADDRCRDRGA
jgi:hypothetical protein